MFTTELPIVAKRALRDLKDTIADIEAGSKVSYDTFNQLSERYFDAVEAMDEIAKMPADKRPEKVDDLIKTIREIRINSWLTQAKKVTGEKVKAGLSWGLNTLANGANAALNAMNKPKG